MPGHLTALQAVHYNNRMLVPVGISVDLRWRNK